MHPLKVVEIKNPFGILQPTTQIPRDWVGIFLFQKNMFWWDTLINTFKSKHLSCSKRIENNDSISRPNSRLKLPFPGIGMGNKKNGKGTGMKNFIPTYGNGNLRLLFSGMTGNGNSRSPHKRIMGIRAQIKIFRR